MAKGLPKTLAEQCETISDFWIGQWGCHQLSILQEHGGETLALFKRMLLRRHQRDYFLPGLDKLGISRDLPPAVIAGRYHYFSNMLGGLKMEYIEESPKRVWIRYLAPSYSFTGVSLAAVPAKVQRFMFSGWHPFNGLSLGVPQLGFVVTKVFQDGEPYDEGYFEEHDRTLEEDERIQYRPVSISPDFDPVKAPKLDEKLWPQERLSRALRNFSRGFLEDSIRSNLGMFGVNSTVDTVAQAMRIFAIQFLRAYEELFGIKLKTAADLVSLFGALSEMANEAFRVEKQLDGALRVERVNRMLAHDRPPEAIFHALAEFWKLSAKIVSARIKVELVNVGYRVDGLVDETWTFADVKDRLF
jgi:hypothetical protein